MDNQTPIIIDLAGTDIQGEIARIRERGPVARVELPGGVFAWSITDASLLEEVLSGTNVSKNPREHWPAFQNGEVPEDWELANWINTPSMFTAYGEDHRRLRKAVAPAFTNRRTIQMEPRIRERAEELLTELEEVPAGHTVDLRERFAFPLPLRVISELLGVPAELRQPLHACVVGVFDTSLSKDAAKATHARMIELLQDLVAYRRKVPGDDMTSTLLHAVDDPGTAFSETELIGSLYLTVNAGHETTVTLLDQAIYLLLTHPEHRAAACSGRLEWERVIEEALRLESPVAHAPLRYAVEDLTLGDISIAKGDPILTCPAGASRDPKVHGATADSFDPTRATVKDHMAFGHGAHHCPGAPLARLEARVALPTLFARFPNLELAPGEDPGSAAGFIANGHRRLPVRLTGV